MGGCYKHWGNIMISKSELAKIAEIKHLTIRNAEKDYLLEHLLFALSDDRRFLAFKGGTALYKFYNLNRFSEDLDFDLTGKRFDVDKIIKKITRNLELTGMQRTLFEKIEYSNETNIRFSIRGPLYDGSKNSMSRVTINISKREQPLYILDKLLISSYPEIPSFELSVIDEREIAAEKIRCIMTRDKPRDIYDLWFLSKKNIAIDISLVDKKLKIYNLIFDLEKFLEKIIEKHKMWKRDLNDFIIGTLPDFNTVFSEIKNWCEKGL